jgi:hypothetical protein
VSIQRKSNHGRLYGVLAGLVACLGVATVHADKLAPCRSAGWNLERELALMAADAAEIEAGTRSAAAPRIEPESVYRVSLVPVGAVRFASQPERASIAPEARGGLVRLGIPSAGRYRVTLDAAQWIDAVQGGKRLVSTRFIGRPACPRLHKVVEFELVAGEALLQLSVGSADRVRLLVTRAPGE